MRRITLLIAIIFIALQVKSQEVSIAGKYQGFITIDELLNAKGLKVEVNEGGAKVINFTVAATINGYEEVVRSNSARITAQQKHLLKKVLPGQRIYFEDIKGIINDEDSVKKVDLDLLKFTIDGPNAHFTRNEYGFATISTILKNPYLFAYPNFSSKDTSQFKVVSFKIKSSQPDYYYEFKSNSNMLTAEIINFIKNATFDFTISDIKAMDKNNKTHNLFRVPISVNQHTIQRTKTQLAKAFDLISPKLNIKVQSFKLWKKGDFDKEEDKYIIAKSNAYSKDMKAYIKTAKIGDLIGFTIYYINANGKEKEIWLKVKIAE